MQVGALAAYLVGILQVADVLHKRFQLDLGVSEEEDNLLVALTSHEQHLL